jgi:predicted GNAT superfamily acetyltransferase/predicted GIY-YIG superfamily endonuclease
MRWGSDLSTSSFNIQYRNITGTSDIQQIPLLERQVWGMTDVDCIPPSLLTSFVHIGGSILGAFDGNTLVGVSVGIPTVDRNRLWSYMTAVHGEYQSLGIGLQLKQEQRQLAAEQNYTVIAWTFDPLQTKNAYFNFCTLGASAERYHIDFYGPMTDSLNKGIPSDRLEVEWKLKGNAPEKHSVVAQSAIPLLEMSNNTHLPRINSEISFSENPLLAIQIPPDINKLRVDVPSIATEWRFALRDSLIACFSNGYKIVTFERNESRFAYILQKLNQWYLYVVKCADGTLYTGISNNPVRRIKQHNTGKGASYTASRRPVLFQGAWLFMDRAAATKAELRLKRLRRAEKEHLIMGHLPFEGSPFIEVL